MGENNGGHKETPEKSRAEYELSRTISRSKFKRSDPTAPNTDIEREGQTFRIETIEDGEAPVLSDVQNLFANVFGAAEVDPEEILRSAVKGENAWGGKDMTKYRVHIVKNAEGKLVSTVAGGRLDLEEHGKPTGRQIFMVAYAVTDPSSKQEGLAREAYVSAVMQAAQEARAEGKELVYVVGECTYTSEAFWNKVGLHRIYGVSQDARSYKELRYVQPAVDFNETDTGKGKAGDVADGAGEAAEHLMIANFDIKSPEKTDVMAAVRAMYSWCNRWPKEAFNGDEVAVKRNAAYVDALQNTFEDGLKEPRSIIFLSKRERDRRRAAGVPIHEHVAADAGHAGSEDF